jgi:hypothetical protein
VAGKPYITKHFQGWCRPVIHGGCSPDRRLLDVSSDSPTPTPWCLPLHLRPAKHSSVAVNDSTYMSAASRYWAYPIFSRYQSIPGLASQIGYLYGLWKRISLRWSLDSSQENPPKSAGPLIDIGSFVTA